MSFVSFLWTTLLFLHMERCSSSSWKRHNATVNGNARGAACVFPYYWGADTYWSCNSYYYKTMWCSVLPKMTSFPDKARFGECPKYDVCDIHKIINDPWRNIGFTSTFHNWPRTDSALAEGWYRITGIGGDVLYQGCPSPGAGGAKDPLALCSGGSHPSLAEGVKNISLCSPGNCQGGGEHVNVLACPGGFYLYYLYPINQSFVTRHWKCNETSCGVNAQCDNSSGGCVCRYGYEIPGTLPTGDSYGCADVDECARDSSLCGPDAKCSNTDGSFNCTCDYGYQKPPGVTITSATNPCQEIKGCDSNPPFCHASSTCVKNDDGFICECQNGKILSLSGNGTVVCNDLSEGNEEASPEVRFNSLHNMIINFTDDIVLPPFVVKSLLESLGEQTKVMLQDTREEKVTAVGNTMLQSTEKLAATMVKPTTTQSEKTVTTKNIEIQALAIGKDTTIKSSSSIDTTHVSLNIGLTDIARNNNGSASVVLTSSNNMGSVLYADLYYTANDTVKIMMSKVFSVYLLKTPNKTLPSPANITIQHIREMDPNGSFSCVYWNGSAWVADGCDVTNTNTTHTVCTCVHFSTISLIMQVERPPETDPMMELLNRIGISIGLGSLTLALLTFAFCDLKVTNTSRLNLCISLLLAHLLLLLVQEFIHLIRPHKDLCMALSGVLHFLFLCCFAWMFLETVWLFHAVLRLTDIRSNQGLGPHWGYQCLIGYGVPFTIVAVSVGIMPEGYGSERCWLNYDKGFIWSFLGPVCCILGANATLFVFILVFIRMALSQMQNSKVHDKLTRTLVIKTLIQSVVIGLPWVLGFFTRSSKALNVLFHVLNSQQGTFIFMLHCVLNQEVRLQFWNRCKKIR